MALLREALEVHRQGTVDERRRWVLRHPTFSSIVVCLVATVAVAAVGLVANPRSVTLISVIVLFGTTFSVSLLLLALALRRSVSSDAP